MKKLKKDQHLYTRKDQKGEKMVMINFLLHVHIFHLTRGMCLGVSFVLAWSWFIPYLPCFKLGYEHKAKVTTFRD